MGKNTIIAFILITLSVIFFTSPSYNKFFNEKILRIKNENDQINNGKKIKEIKTVKENNIIEEKKLENNESDITTLKINEIEKGDTIWIENNLMIIGIKEMGALITSIKMKGYKQENTYIDIISNNTEGGAQTIIGNKSYNNKLFKFSGEQKKEEINKGSCIAEFIYIDDDGEEIIKRFKLKQDEYIINISLQKKSLSGNKINIGWYCGIEETETDQQKNLMEKRLIHFYNGENVEHVQLKKEGEGDSTTGRYHWIGITSKYFFISLNNEQICDCDLKYEIINKNKDKNFNYKFEISKIAEKNEEKFFIFAGPSKIDVLKKNKIKYEKILFPVMGWTKIFFWSEIWFPLLAEMVLILLIYIQKFVKDFGIAIIVLTIITKIITYPLTLSSLKSMEKIKDIQPKINKIRQKYQYNPKKMNEEIMALYKKEGVNPFNLGCLPMFLQMPVFIALFVVLRNSIEIRNEKTFLIPWVNDLSKPEVLISLEKILPNGIPLYGNNIALLPILMALVTFYQQKMTIKDPNQKAMIYFMPIFMLVLFNSFPSGLVLYWTFSSALQLIQQIFSMKRKH